MTEGEQERELGKMVLKLREKELEQRCLQNKLGEFSRVLKSVFKLHENGEHNEALLAELDKLPGDNEIIGAFRSLVEVKADIEQLKGDLGLRWES